MQLQKWESSLSDRQKTTIEQFTQTFASLEKVYKYFCPANFAHAISHETECVTYPCITLSQVDKVYRTDGAARNIVRNMMVGIYSMSAAREQIQQEAVDSAAGIIVAKYGNACTLYGVMLYFANYLSDYKSTYLQFDVQDIIQQFNKKFIPWWHARLSRANNEHEEVKVIAGPVGMDGLKEFVRKELEQGHDLRSGYLYECGTITDDMIRDTEQQINSRVF